MRRADALSPASKAFSTSLGSVRRGLFFAFFSPIPSTVHSSVRLCCTPSSASCLPVCHSKIAALYTTSVQMPPSIQPRLESMRVRTNARSLGHATAPWWACAGTTGGRACWQHNNRTEARTGLLRCGRQGGKSAGQHWLLVLALPTRKLPLGEIVPHGSLHLASSKKSISAIFLN